jgi:hypothetical protein
MGFFLHALTQSTFALETNRQINEVLGKLPRLTEEQLESLGHGGKPQTPFYSSVLFISLKRFALPNMFHAVARHPS